MPKPMLTDDYLIRMINQAIAVLLTIARLKESGQYQQAQQMIEQSLEQLIGLRINLIRSLEDHNILNTLTLNGAVDYNRVLTIGDLFKEEGDVLAAQKKANASNWSYERALYFYLTYENSQDTTQLPDFEDKIAYLVKRLDGVSFQFEPGLLLSEYLERKGKYVQGYRVLEQLSINQEGNKEAFIQRINYLERLIPHVNHSDLDGLMSREEIMEEIAILQGYTG